MTGKIFINAFLLGVTVLILCAVLFFGVQYAQIKEETYSALRQEAVYAANGVMLLGEDYLSTLGTGNRITWIDEDGKVIFDNRYGVGISNQKEYSEVSDALADGEGQCIRNSVSGGSETMYYAVRCSDGTVLRLSKSMAAVREALIAVSPILWIFVLVLLISGVLAFHSAKQLIIPINSIRLDDPDSSKTYPELAPLVERIRDQNLTISEQMDERARRQREFAALTENMSEGFILTDKNGVVLIANKSSALLIKDCYEGKNLLENDDACSNAVKDALSGKRTDSVITVEEGSRQLIVNPVTTNEKITGVAILAVDVTEREQRERLRREFSANVSHELKTPLTSISGFAELMMQGMVSGDKVKEFSTDIFRESQRLIALVEDIIKLSKLDEQGELPNIEKIDIYTIAEDTADSLRNAADKTGVSLSVTGGHAYVRGIEQYIDEIVYNLCDNSIKYNKPGGNVTVDIKNSGENVVLTVADTGIGIPFEHRERVFERFYRVNKSHSKSVSGTGLGLSIVKHAAQACGAKIELESEQDKGTTVRVIFISA